MWYRGERLTSPFVQRSDYPGNPGIRESVSRGNLKAVTAPQRDMKAVEARREAVKARRKAEAEEARRAIRRRRLMDKSVERENLFRHLLSTSAARWRKDDRRSPDDRNPSTSLRAASGGLPTLGKRHR